MTDFRALCAELVDDLELCDWPYNLKETIRADIDRARAALAEPEPEGPTDEELESVARAAEIQNMKEQGGLTANDANGVAAQLQLQRLAGLRAVLARWSRPAPQPVPVSERLPGPSDCAPWPKDSDASAWCWAGTDENGGWNWEQRSAGCLVMFPDDFTHWLPAHALPIPHQQEDHQ